MKTATVPAQITTVEDKTAGNLTLKQMLLLAGPIFIDFTIYALFPRMLKLNLYKLVLMSLITLITTAMAMRVKGKILIDWALAIYRYNSRPRYYVFDKNSMFLRANPYDLNDQVEREVVDDKHTEQTNIVKLPPEEILRLETVLANELTRLYFTTNKKGELHVGITQIK